MQLLSGLVSGLALLLASADVPADDLARVLVRPEAVVHARILQRVENFAVQPREVEVAADYVWDTYERLGQLARIDRQRLPSRLTRTWSEGWTMHGRQWLSWGPDGWSLEKRTTNEAGQVLTQHFVADETSVRNWSLDGGDATVVSVTPAGPPEEVARGFLLSHVWFQRSVGVLRSEIERRGIAASGDGGAWEIPIDEAFPWDAFGHSLPATVVRGLAHGVSLEAQRTEHDLRVTVEWSTDRDEPLNTQTQVWPHGAVLPAAMRIQRHLLGFPGRLLYDARYIVEIVPEHEASEARQDPDRQAAVFVDHRFFDESVVYQVDADTPPPSDAVIMERALAQHRLGLAARMLGAEPGGHEPRRATDEPRRFGPLLAQGTLLDLGAIAVGTRRHVVFELHHTGDRELTIGRVDSACDCLDAAASTHRLAPGESLLVSGVQEIQDLGFHERTLALDVRESLPDVGRVELRVRFEGLPGVLAEPSALQLGPGGGDGLPPAWPVELRVGQVGGAPTSAPPRATVTGNFDGEVEWEADGDGTWLSVGVLRPRWGAPFGRLRGALQVVFEHAQTARTLSVPVTALHVPPRVATFPACTAVLRAGDTVTLHFDGLSLELGDGLELQRQQGLHVSLASEGDATRLRIARDSERPTSPGGLIDELLLPLQLILDGRPHPLQVSLLLP